MKDVLRASYDRSADRYDEEFRPLQREKYAALLGSPTAARFPAPVLDLGGGTGLLAEWLGREDIVCADFSAAMLRRARSRGPKAVQADVEMLPFRDERFRSVAAFTVLGILPGSPRRALSEAARVLAPGGTLAVTLLRASWTPAFEHELDAAGFERGPRRECGQDYGYLCRRT